MLLPKKLPIRPSISHCPFKECSQDSMSWQQRGRRAACGQFARQEFVLPAGNQTRGWNAALTSGVCCVYGRFAVPVGVGGTGHWNEKTPVTTCPAVCWRSTGACWDGFKTKAAWSKASEAAL